MFFRLWLEYVFRPVNYSTEKLHQILVSSLFCRQRTWEKVYGKWQLKSGRLEVHFSVQLSDGVENIMGKGEIARYEQFLLFQQCFQRLSVVDASKWVSSEWGVNLSILVQSSEQFYLQSRLQSFSNREYKREEFNVKTGRFQFMINQIFIRFIFLFSFFFFWPNSILFQMRIKTRLLLR